MEHIQKEDRAFLNSILSYAIYTKNAVWFEPWAKVKNLNPQASVPPLNVPLPDHNEKTGERLIDRAFAFMVAKNFSPVNLSLPAAANHISKQFLYKYDSQYNSGIYKAMDNFSAACAMKSLNSEGTYTMHVSFRGTDTLAKSFLKFLTKSYPDMQAYYDSFKPFENAVLEYAKDPANKISKIEVSGHSLGGAMVQQFFHSKEVKNSGLTQEMEGFTYGSPAAISKNIYKLIPALRHLVVMGNIKNMITTIKDMLDKPIKPDIRITQYEHNGDLVPFMGKYIANKKIGAHIVNLNDVSHKSSLLTNMLTGEVPKNSYEVIIAQEEATYRAAKGLPQIERNKGVFAKFMAMSETAGELLLEPVKNAKKALAFVFHDMARYTVNLENNIQEMKLQYKKDTGLHATTPYLNQFKDITNVQSLALERAAMSNLLGQPSNPEVASHLYKPEEQAIYQRTLPNLAEFRDKFKSSNSLQLKV